MDREDDQMSTEFSTANELRDRGETRGYMWATEFAKKFRIGTLHEDESISWWTGPSTTLEIMGVWFANAVETGREEGRKEALTVRSTDGFITPEEARVAAEKLLGYLIETAGP
jgi:hypothetical protein